MSVSSPSGVRVDPGRTLWMAGVLFAVPARFFPVSVAGGRVIGTTHPPEAMIDLFGVPLGAVVLAVIAMGITGLLVAVPAIRAGLAGYFAGAFAWSGVLGGIMEFHNTYQRIVVN